MHFIFISYKYERDNIIKNEIIFGSFILNCLFQILEVLYKVGINIK